MRKKSNKMGLRFAFLLASFMFSLSLAGILEPLFNPPAVETRAIIIISTIIIYAWFWYTGTFEEEGEDY